MYLLIYLDLVEEYLAIKLNRSIQLSNSWFKKFKKRHPDIKLRKPQKRSFERANAISESTFQAFFLKLKTLLDSKKFDADSIWNVDESPFFIDMTLSKVNIKTTTLIFLGIN